MDRVVAHRRFANFTWVVFAFLLGVITFGAWVRITHSGAGCGSHWPTCNGEIVPLSPSVETVIEYVHRLTSGLLGIVVVGLLAWAIRRFGAKHRITRAAMVTVAFTVLEALVGAGLVLGGLVADDDSVSRAVVVAFHLVNTLALTAACGLTAWWASDDRRVRPMRSGRGVLWPVVMFVALVVTSMSGAVTALGDTLFPVHPSAGVAVIEQVRADLDAANHFLVRLRMLHPVVAVLSAGLVMGVAASIRARSGDPKTRRLTRVLRDAVAIQVIVGVVNIGLAAPGWLQLGHLLVGQLVWVSAVLATVSIWSERMPDHHRG